MHLGTLSESLKSVRACILLSTLIFISRNQDNSKIMLEAWKLYYSETNCTVSLKSKYRHLSISALIN